MEPNVHEANTSTASSSGHFSPHPDLVHFIVSGLEEGDAKRVKDHFDGLHSGDIAEILQLLNAEQRRDLMQLAGDIITPDVLTYLEADVREEVLKGLGAEESAAVITQLASDDAVQVMEDLGEQAQQHILEALPQAQREELTEALASPEDAARRLVETDFVSIPENWDVGQVIDHLRNGENLPQDFHNIFVVDQSNRPVGAVLVSRVLRSPRDARVREIMDRNLWAISPDMDQEDVAYIFRKYGLASAPVVDEAGHITGVITLNDIMDVMDEEAEEDLMRLSGVSETDLHAPAMETSRRRFPWLLINLATAILASMVIAFFEGAIEQLVVLAVLMPIVASMAGNAGTQTLAVAIRGLTTRELSEANARRLLIKELSASMLNGVAFAVIVGLACFLIYHNVMLSAVFAMAMLGALAVAGFAGAFIPMLLERVGADPAISSAVFLTTVTDLAAFFIFLGLATIILI